MKRVFVCLVFACAFLAASCSLADIADFIESIYEESGGNTGSGGDTENGENGENTDNDKDDKDDKDGEDVEDPVEPEVDGDIITVAKGDKEVQVLFELLNEFRTGNEAYYLNEDNKTYTSVVGQLGELVLDETLCEISKIRSKEIMQVFDHVRPDGSKWSTAFDECHAQWHFRGENIAAGHLSGEETLKQWKEDTAKYSGQGHRRNMLDKDYKKVGLARSYSSNTKYGYYWVMTLSD